MNDVRKALATVSKVPATVLIVFIKVYQKTLSPDHGWMRHLYPYGFCRHHPTCSMYSIEVFRSKSYPAALFLSLKRILSCHPWKKVSDDRLRDVIKGTSQWEN